MRRRAKSSDWGIAVTAPSLVVIAMALMFWSEKGHPLFSRLLFFSAGYVTQGVFAALILNTLLYSAGPALLVRFFLRLL
jgi:hypothetical protein